MSERCCGICPDFSLTTASGAPVGEDRTQFTDGSVVVEKLGFCRAPMGLALGVRSEKGACLNASRKNTPLSNPQKVS